MTNTLNNLDPTWAWAAYEPDANRPFDRAAAAHLFRRAGFGATWAQLEQAVKDGPGRTIERLFDHAAPPADDAPTTPPVADTPAGADAFDKQMHAMGMSMMATGDPHQLSAWWLYRMMHTPDQLLEKTTLFWHGHFATSAAKVDSARLMLAHNELLRKHALGEFEPFVQAISRDPAMLLWLDAATNRKVRPNENYARELMELFCLGLGHYTEKDIKEVARTFTGWEVVRNQFRFNKYQHDTGVKSFLGSSGNFDGDDAVRIVLGHAASPRFIAAKLARFFISEEPALPDALIEPLAKQLRETDFDIGALLRTMLSSNLFFSGQVRGRIVRSPVCLGIGLLRALEAHANVKQLAQGLQELGQSVFYPPNVKGWDGGRTWINSSTLLGRANLVRQVLFSGDTRFAGGKLADLFDMHDVRGGEQAVDLLLELLVAAPVSPDVRQRLIKAADGPGDRNTTLANLIHTVSAMPEFHLM